MTTEPLNIVIAGGGVAGVEALLGLHALAGDRVRLTLVAPDPDFRYRPLAVAEPFAQGHAARVPLARFTEDTGATLVLDAVTEVDDAGGVLRLRDGGSLRFDALLLAPGGRPVEGVAHATTWWPGGDPDVYGGLLGDLEQGYSSRLAIVIPPGAVWPLPAYELALMTARETRSMGRDDVEITLITPESAPLALFGRAASAALADELSAAGIRVRTGVIARGDGGNLVLEPSGEPFAADRIVAIPRLVGPRIAGVPADDAGFVIAGDDARVDGCERTWAAGDGVVSPLKFGGLATHQARRAISAIAAPRRHRGRPRPGRARPARASAGGRPLAPARPRRRRRRRAAVVAGREDRGRVPAALAGGARPRSAGAQGAAAARGARAAAAERAARSRGAVPLRPRTPVPDRRSRARRARPAHA